MLEESRWILASEQPRDLDLAAGRREEVVAANDERHSLHEIVDGRGELIRPVAFAVADDDVAALRRRLLLLRTVPQIVESLDRVVEPHAQGDAAVVHDPTRPASTRVQHLFHRA